MSVIVPQSVMKAVEEAAKRRRLSVPEFVEKALAAQSTAVLSDPYLEERAKRATAPSVCRAPRRSRITLYALHTPSHYCTEAHF